MKARAAAAVIVGALFIAGCTSTVVLGTLGGGGGSTDLARPTFDAFDGGGDFSGGDAFDGGGDFSGGDAFDGGLVIDLAH
jgi:hypothetical protein